MIPIVGREKGLEERTQRTSAIMVQAIVVVF